MNIRNLEANPLIEQFSEYLSKINDALKRELDLYSWSEFYAPLRYACDGGKRIRPLILVLSAESAKVGKAKLFKTWRRYIYGCFCYRTFAYRICDS